MLGLRRIARLLAASAAAAALVLLAGGVIVNGTRSALSARDEAGAQPAYQASANKLFLQGRRIFRYDTFGDQAFWGGALQLHKAIEGAGFGGVGGGVSPKTALALGLKVDSAALPKKLVSALKAGKVDLDSPATTLALLKLNAVVGLKGFFNKGGSLSGIGVTCAACHSTVDNSFAPGVGRRLDGWANRDLNVGAIINAAPDHRVLTDLLKIDDATLSKVLLAWGPGRFDAEVALDGKGFRPDGRTGAVLIPAAYGLAGVNLATYTGWGTVTYWNAFVANLEMHGQGNFYDPRLDDASRFPVAARASFGHVTHKPDLVSPALPALHYYQLSLRAPRPPKGSFNRAAAARGQAIFNGQGRCSSCHIPPTYSEPGYNLHTPSEICTDSFTADRSPTGKYRTAPLRGLWARAKGSYYHDGRYPNLLAVVDHYNSCFNLGLSSGQEADLVQFLKSR
jgi:cytochrome c peroxidase